MKKMKRYEDGGDVDYDKDSDSEAQKVYRSDLTEISDEERMPRRAAAPAPKKASAPKKAAAQTREDSPSMVETPKNAITGPGAYFGRARSRAASTAKSSPGVLESLRSAYNRPRTYATPAEEERARKLTEAKQGMKKGGSVRSSASRRADGIAQRGKTRGRVI